MVNVLKKFAIFALALTLAFGVVAPAYAASSPSSSKKPVTKYKVTEELRKLGIRVFPGEANYLLLYSETDLCGEMLRRDILLRDCADYIGLRKGFARIAVRTKKENDALLAALREVSG